MDTPYKAIVNKEYQYPLTEKDLENFDPLVKSPSSLHVLQDAVSVDVEVVASSFSNRSYTLQINGNTYTVQIENELDALIETLGLTLGASSIVNEIHAPMPGLILEVQVAAGQEVKKGDFLCVLEAMKMENTLLASRDGIIKSVKIAKGETVDKGDLLIEFEA